ncbi:MAG: alpha/beta hydrolase [Planctomycetaceae bacterium]|nr:alpha/beta hydrolase [Planctomycetaceae bacterium]
MLTPGRIPQSSLFVALACGVLALYGTLLGDEPAGSPPASAPTLDELLLFRPTKFPVGDWEPQDLDYQDVWFTAEDGVRLHGWYCPHDDPVAHVLHLHGSGGNLSDRRFLLKHLQTNLRLSLFIFDYRGYGRSEGAATVSGALLDAAAARREFAKLVGCESRDIVLQGHSLGGAIAVQLAATEAPRALIVESSFSSLKDIATLHYPNLAWVVPDDKLNSVAAIPNYKGPYLQSHGTADSLIPLASGKKLFDAANGPKRFIRMPRLDHNDPPSRAYYAALDRFLKDLPKPAR